MTGPKAASRRLLDAVPRNKILGFGGDYLFVDEVYGHLALVRENISRVLAHKVEFGVFSFDKAIETAWMMLYSNPLQVFELEPEF